MESFQYYKEYGIRYYSLTGTTVVETLGFAMKVFRGKGEAEGLKLAKEYIDNN